MVQYRKPESIEEALFQAGSAAGEQTKYLAGGTDLVVQIAEGAVYPAMLIDITGIEALRGMERTAEGLRIGAATTIAEILEAAGGEPDELGLPECLVQGARSIGSPQIRRLATIGGNVCNASPCGDTLAPIIVLAGTLSLRSEKGGREVPAEEFFLGPKATVLQPGEILESILIPSSHLEGRCAFRMIGKRNGQVISQVNIAVWINEPGAAIEEIRIAAGSVAPIPLRLRKAEELLRGSVPDEPLLQAAQRAVQEEIRPISDVRTSEEYRRSVTAALFRDALAEALEA
jgi:carbon-monoxide dehydrogenase medium subunit